MAIHWGVLFLNKKLFSYVCEIILSNEVESVLIVDFVWDVHVPFDSPSIPGSNDKMSAIFS